MPKQSSQKFIGRNRAPRVQIEYDVDDGNAEKAVQLPFVMGVMSDLSGKSEQKKSIGDRKFIDIDADTFDAKLKAMKPRVAFSVPNAIEGDGNMAVDITFESMDDFSPVAIARKVSGLSSLLERRTKLANLLANMDGRDRAEEILTEILQDSELLKERAAQAESEKGEE